MLTSNDLILLTPDGLIERLRERDPDKETNKRQLLEFSQRGALPALSRSSAPTGAPVYGWPDPDIVDRAALALDVFAVSHQLDTVVLTLWLHGHSVEPITRLREAWCRSLRRLENSVAHAKRNHGENAFGNMASTYGTRIARNFGITRKQAVDAAAALLPFVLDRDTDLDLEIEGRVLLGQARVLAEHHGITDPRVIELIEARTPVVLGWLQKAMSLQSMRDFISRAPEGDFSWAQAQWRAVWSIVRRASLRLGATVSESGKQVTPDVYLSAALGRHFVPVLIYLKRSGWSVRVEQTISLGAWNRCEDLVQAGKSLFAGHPLSETSIVALRDLCGSVTALWSGTDLDFLIGRGARPATAEYKKVK